MFCVIGLTLIILFQTDNFKSVPDHFETFCIVDFTSTIFIYLNSTKFSRRTSLTSLKRFLQKFSVTDDFINFGHLSVSFTIFILNVIAILCTLSSLTSLMNFSFSLNLGNNFPCWYAIRMIFFFLVRMTSSYSLVMVPASSEFSTFSACLFNSSASTFLLLKRESTNCFLISCLLSLLVFVVLLEPPFLNYEQKMAMRL